MIDHHPDTCLALSRQLHRELLEAAAQQCLARSARPPRRTLVAIATAALRGRRPAVKAKPVTSVAIRQS